MIDFNLGKLFDIGGEDENGQFFAPMWSQRTENTYSDFFKHGGWKKPGEWLNPGGVMANPAQQIADPGNFFSSQEHKNWVSDGKVSDRTIASALAAALAYGGGSAISAYGAGGSGSGAGAGAGGSMSGINAGNFSLMGGGEAGQLGGSTTFSLMGDATSTAAPSVAGGTEGLSVMAPSIFGTGGAGASGTGGFNWQQLLSMGGNSNNSQEQSSNDSGGVAVGGGYREQKSGIGHGNEGVWSNIQSALSGVKQTFQNNPEKWAIALDKIGTNLAPDNAFAGLGTMMAKSSLANKARANQQQDIGAALASGGSAKVGGTASTGTGKVTPTTSAVPGLTPPAAGGVTSQTQQAKPDGSVETVIKHTTAAPAPAQPRTISQQDLTGLSPAEINAISGRDISIGNLKNSINKANSTAAYQQASIEAVQKQIPAKNYANRMLGLQRQQKALENVMNASIAAKESPMKIDKLKAEIAKLKSEQQKVTLEYQQEIIRQNILQKLAGSRGDLSALSDAELVQILGPQATASMRNATITQSRLTVKDREANAAKRTVAYADSAARAFAAESPEEAIAEINRANINSPDSATRALAVVKDSGLIWDSQNVGWVDLPITPDGKQITMADVRKHAEKVGMDNAIQWALAVGQSGRRQ